jgi:hypothetical protein
MSAGIEAFNSSNERFPKREGVFFETNTRNLRVRRLNERREINGIMAQGFDVRYTPAGRRRAREEGNVWLCIETGSPVLSELSPTRTPRFVRSINNRVYYNFLSETNQFVKVKTVSTSEGGALGFRMSLNITLISEDFWEYKF